MSQRAFWMAGLVWIASWYVIYLEIFRWHHVTRSLQLNPPAAPAGFPPPYPGVFLLTARSLSLAAPLAFFLLLIARQIHGGGDSTATAPTSDTLGGAAPPRSVGR